MKLTDYIGYMLAAAAMVSTFACSDSNEDTDDGFTQTSHIIKGKVEKGPMVRGSQIDMRTLDRDMNPTGSSYTATIENNAGDFNYGALKVSSPYAKLTADGYFFNEVSGTLSNGTIKLDAIVDLSDNSTINVNVLTHLKSARISHLIANDGMSFKDANKQAQEELLTQFGLQEYSTKDASQFSIASGDDASGALIAISSLVLSDHTEAEIVEYLSLLSNEFSTTGGFSERTKERLRSTRNYLNSRLGLIASNIKSRYQELGYDITIKDLAYYFDWNNDGVAGNELDDSDTVVLSQDEIEVPAEGGEYTITIESDKQYFLEAPSSVANSDTDLDITPPNFSTDDTWSNDLYESGTTSNQADMEYTKSIEKNSIKVVVAPAKFRTDKSSAIKIYNARGIVAAELTIKQKGNPNIWIDTPKLGSAGIAVISSCMTALRDAIAAEQNLESSYVLQDVKQPFTPNNDHISTCWSKYYTAINQLLFFKDADAKALDCYQPYIDTYLALAYYQLTSHWGGVPFLTKQTSDFNPSIARTNEQDILSSLSGILNEATSYLEEKRNDSFTDANSIMFVSKDVARTLLAYIHCNRQEYSQALPLLETVISNGFYSLVASSFNGYENDSECILGFILGTRSGESCHPCLDYKDLILTAAECCYHCGNLTKARGYIESVCNAKGLEVDNSDILKAIGSLKQRLHSPNYLTFIRRNNLGIPCLGLTSNQTYQLLWPIPAEELMYNTAITQNPGY